MNFTELEHRLGHAFRQRELLQVALTHPSYTGDHQGPHYQRLEFLGDAVLQLAVSHHLYQHLPEVPEGRLTRLRASLVREESLCEAARRFGLGQFIRLSHGEEREGGRAKPSILADVMEAVIAAVYLDAGFEAARALVDRALSEALGGVTTRDAQDAKTALQEHLQKQGLQPPEYQMVREEGQPHERIFTVRVLVEGKELGEGAGRSKKEAQQRAAHQALDKLQH